MVKMEKRWTVKGKYIIITGATSGIGLATAKELVKRGANLGIIARNQVKANELATQLKNVSGGKTVVDVFLADMSSQESIRQVAKEILSKCPKIDILINNAGAMFDRRQESVDGMEMTWAVNHLGPFLLTTLLLERLKENGNARIITTASHGHKMVKKGIDFDDIHAKSLYSFPKMLFGGPTIRYGETKLANILFTTELAKRLEGTGVTAHCFDPGLVATNFNQNNGLLARLTMAGMKPFSRSPEKGAETLVWLADTDDISEDNGGYYADMKKILPSVPAQNLEAAKRLWEISQEQVG
ncbi:short-chain dehydrogenase [Heyndrickxia shackletonii]|uniref:Short-chain dehydrogenase n=2 Tax=Bacillaceae TaxID=186817 RepID=A0A0Q3WUL2_9BACI|nr:SDR family oxidoreductase [Heyndrickxia shackletonii]KQL52437.1 short-chain dehydrogenase [Heyndrickxia shackletonii]MBB2479217.1 SDR family oxidoreductase [Bacillus sp. APMAM]NEY98999.1 SDR family oxidoreductase [Heyndrickxia shackletonii]RTZ57116.1 SDR family oxidoreductase [Bacillus sp. SAJ1]